MLRDDEAVPDVPSHACLTGGARYVSHFERLFDDYPDSLKRMFCTVQLIVLQEKQGGLAYAGFHSTFGGPVDGAEIGIRPSILDASLDFTNILSWKEQLSFGGSLNPFEFRKDLPIYRTDRPLGVSGFLSFVFAHEFAHILDRMNQLNHFHPPPLGSLGEHFENEWIPDSGSWAELSWSTDQRPFPENDFFRRSDLCFYDCGNRTISPEAIPRLYSELNRSNFIDAYASTSPREDFAQTFAYWVVAKHEKVSVSLDVAPGIAINLTEKIESARMATKISFLEQLLSRTDLRYPGEGEAR